MKTLKIYSIYDDKYSYNNGDNFITVTRKYLSTGLMDEWIENFETPEEAKEYFNNIEEDN